VFELTLRIGFSLLVVLALMWGLARLARRPRTGRGGATLTVLARQQLGRSASVAVIRVADRALVVGVTDGQVNLLAETDLAALERPAEQPEAVREPVALDGLPRAPLGAPTAPGGRLTGSALSPATWRQAVNALRDRTVRR
jgi:flagellar protein FliO/FliZ